MTRPDLSSWIAQAKGGNREAFDRLVHATARLVYAQIVAAVRDRQKAEDLTQETFLAAWKHLGTLDKPEGFTAWLLTLARNTTFDALKFDTRKKRDATRTATGEAALQAESPHPAPPDVLAAAEARDRALQLLEELPEEYRRPLAMRYLGGADYAAIASALALSEGALRGMLTRGMALLRERLSRTQDVRP